MTLLEQIKEVLNEAEKFTDLKKEIKKTVFVDSDNNQYDSLEQAFEAGITDFSNFEKKEIKVNPIFELSKLINDNYLSSDDIEIINKFSELAQKLDIQKDLERKRTKLYNYKTKAKKANDKAKLNEIEKELERIKQQMKNFK